MPREVLIIQPYIAAYRVPLFEQLHERLAADDINLEIVFGKIPARQAARKDAHTLPFAREIPARHPPTGDTYIRHRQVSTRGKDLVIAEHALGSLDTYEKLLVRRAPTAIWGHARPLSDMDRAISARLNRWQITRATHVFAYTEPQRELIIEWGADPAAVTALNNATDTRRLRTLAHNVTSGDVDAFRERHGLGTDPVLLFVGGLDPTKRLESLLEIVATTREKFGPLHLLIAGDGPQRDLIENYTKTNPWVHFLGRVEVPDLALLSQVASALVNPGLVGLLAVDSFAMGLPIVTTQGTHHSPEFAYLESGVNALIVDDNEAAMVDGLLALLADPTLAATLRQGCLESAQRFSIEAMAARFHTGITIALGGPVR